MLQRERITTHSWITGIQWLCSTAGRGLMVLGLFAACGWLFRDVLGLEIGYRGELLPFVLLAIVGAGFYIGGRR